MKLSFYLHKYHNYDRDRIQVKTRRVTKKLVTLLSFAYLKDSFIYLNKKYYIILVTKKLVTLLSFAYLKDSFIYLNKKYYIIFLTIKNIPCPII